VQISSRHHYIPQFYIKGFVNNAGFLYIYDKQKKSIKKNISPKSIFFERDRNTMYFDEKTSILEDKWYKDMDDKCSQVVQNLRENTNEQGILNSDNLADIQFFILCLFWRIPKTDNAFERFFQESEIFFTDKNEQKITDTIKEQELKDDLSYKKFARADIILQALRNFNQKPGQVYAQLFDKAEDLFLLGDYPMVFERIPATFDDLFHTDYYLPVSSKRLFGKSENDRELAFDFEKIIKLNAIIIDQSVRYVCCSSLEYLERSVAYYEAVKAKSLIPLIHKHIFKT
jgi:hypothetical protein